MGVVPGPRGAINLDTGRDAILSFPWELPWGALSEWQQASLWQVLELMSPMLALPYTAHFKQMQVHLHPNRGPHQPILYGGGMGGSKAGILTSMVMTPFGERAMGDMRVGDAVSNPDGTVAKIVAVHPQGMREVYRVRFTDGTETTCTGDHLWLAWKAMKRSSKADKRYIDGSPSVGRIWTTNQLRVEVEKGYVQAQNRPGTGGAMLIPVSNPTVFTKPSRWPASTLPPYALGVLLGDGHLSTRNGASFVSEDHQIAARMEEVLGCTLTRAERQGATVNYRIPAAFAKPQIEALGLLGARSLDKFIPKEYKYRSVEDRWELLRGLMDTDGHATSDGKSFYCTISQRLALDVRWLIESLGGTATISRNPAGYRKDGEYIACNDAFILYVKFPDPSKAFGLQRKKDLAKPPQGMYRRIESIDPAGTEEAQCITVDHPNGLYLTDDFIVTHNSTTICGQCVRLTRTIPNAYTGVFRFTFTALRDSTLRTLRRYARWPEYEENKSEHTFTHQETGGVIKYGQLGREEDIVNLGSSEYTFAAIDEAPQVERAVFEMLQTRVRQMEGARANELGLWLTANPTPGWIHRDFILKPRQGYAFVPALLADNPFADAGYAEAMRLAMADSPERYQAWIEGDWNAYVQPMAVVPQDLLRLAMDRSETPDWNDVAWGVDPGHQGEDDTAVWSRAGTVYRRVGRWLGLRTDQTVDRLKALYWGRLRAERPMQINVDIDGLGAGVWDGLVRAQEEGQLPMPPELVVIGVHNNSRAFATQEVTNPLRYANVKTEDMFSFRGLLESGRGDVEDDPDVFGDLTTPTYDVSGGRLVLISKDITKKLLGRSPNDGDALILAQHRGRADEIAGRARTGRAPEMTAEGLAQLQRQAAQAAVEEKARRTIEAVTGAVLPRPRARARRPTLPY